MRKSDIEKQLKNELHQATPSAFDKLWEKCEHASVEKEKEYVLELEKVAVGVENETHRTGGRRWFTALTSLFLAVALAIVAVWGVTEGWFKKDGGGMGSPSMSKGYFLLDVNPSVEVGYDENGNVDEVVGLNADGKVLVYGLEEELVGVSYEQAVDVLFDRCVKLGYFSASNTANAVLVSATKESGGKDEAMTENVRKRFAERFVEKKLCGVAITGKEDPSLQEEADKYGIDTQKYALIQQYLAEAERLGVESDIDENEYGEISIREIYEELEELEEFKIGDEASDAIEEVLERKQERLESEIDEDIFGDLEELAETLEKAKTYDELKALGQPIFDVLEQLEMRVEGQDKDVLSATKEEISNILGTADADKEKLDKSTEEVFKEREEEHKDDFEKEAEEPEGGFGAWQEENQGHFEEDWHGKKEEWLGMQPHR